MEYMAKNSAPIRTKRPAELKKAKINHRTEWTGFFAIITKSADTVTMVANI